MLIIMLVFEYVINIVLDRFELLSYYEILFIFLIFLI